MHRMTVKERIFQKVGSGAKVARWCGVHPSQCSRWDWIPSKYQQAILDGARAEGIDLTPEDFFETEDGAAA